MPTPTHEIPASVSAGDTLAFLVRAPDTPASAGWTGSAKLVGPATAAATVSASGDDFLVTFAAADMVIAAGDYRIVVTVAKDGQRYTVLRQAIRLELDPESTSGSQGLTHAQKMLTLIRSALEGRATTDHESYSIGGRSISKIPMRELTRLEGIYAAKVRALQNRGKPLPSVAARFVSPGAR